MAEQGLPRAAAALSEDVDAAVTRASRAAGVAREQAERFRDDAGADSERGRTGGVASGADEPSLREAAREFRGEQRLPLATSEADPRPGERAATAGEEPATDDRRGSRSSDEDDDFSQERILS
ncbi:MAG: hypothetical protein ACRDQA_25910 [Nocardioidaceae bacterium]